MTAEEELSKRVVALEEEAAQLRRAVVSHRLVDQAIGVVVAVGRLGPEQGWEVLREISQHTNTKLSEVAEQLVRGAHRGRLPDDIRRALAEALSRTGPGRVTVPAPAEGGRRADSGRGENGAGARVDNCRS